MPSSLLLGPRAGGEPSGWGGEDRRPQNEPRWGLCTPTSWGPGKGLGGWGWSAVLCGEASVAA